MPAPERTSDDGRCGGREVGRRSVLATLGTVGFGTAAGCVGDAAESDDGTRPDASDGTSSDDSTAGTDGDDADATATPDRPDGYATPDPPAFDEPDEVTDGVELFRGVTFEETPEATLKLDFHRPEGGTDLPLVLHVHGGAWEYGSRGTYTRWHADHGMAAATIDYRLSGTAEYPAAVRDVVAAVTWLRTWAAESAGIDPERVALRGASAGAHLAALVATAPGTETFAPVGLDPNVGSVDGFVGVSGIYDLGDGNGESDVATKFFGCPPSDCPDVYREASPVEHVDGEAPPALLWHGRSDQLVPTEQSERFRAALEAADVPVTTLLPEDADHVQMLKDPWREAFRAAERSFLVDVLDL
ncbi:alpha/beta hydrolase [Halostella salina]|uniref:alpha/beta hydrolase n=1 Tax=Halostella salina TaxID=1547897 RepID=UPI000EF79EB7|nr:alpha/beta hydrolase [Halostella salina]